jgi:hypothetical protein
MMSDGLRLGSPDDPWTAPQSKGAAMATLLGFLLDHFADCAEMLPEMAEEQATLQQAFPWPGPCDQRMVDAALVKRGAWGGPLLD